MEGFGQKKVWDKLDKEQEERSIQDPPFVSKRNNQKQRSKQNSKSAIKLCTSKMTVTNTWWSCCESRVNWQGSGQNEFKLIQMSNEMFVMNKKNGVTKALSSIKLKNRPSLFKL